MSEGPFPVPTFQAQEHLTTATAMHREMDLGFWLAQGGAALSAAN